MSASANPAPPRPMRTVIFVELLLIIVCILYVTRDARNFSTQGRIAGFEYSYLVNSGMVASVIYQRTGAIPLWNPFMGRGEPLLENPFSFTLNPLMTLPMLWFGGVNGAKIAVTIHALIAGLGGWLLAYVLNLRSPGRIMLGLILSATGSMPALLYDGFFQMGLSQAYVPAIYAGVVGTIYSNRRWTIGLLAVATTLMLFAGTYWYVLPTAIGCFLLVVFGVFRRSKRMLIDWGAIGRLCVAVLWIATLSAVRMIPQIAHRDLVDHPVNWLNSGYVADFFDISQLYFNPVVKDSNSGYYHYVFPAVLALALVVSRPFVRRSPGILKGSWRIWIPGLVLIFFFTAWGQEATPFNQWMYEKIPFLREWRYLMRIMAAAAVWIGIVGSIWFDDLVGAVSYLLFFKQGLTPPTWGDVRSAARRVLPRRASSYEGAANALPSGRVWARGAVSAALVLIGVAAGYHVTQNWERKFGFWTTANAETPMINFLRRTHPAEMLMVNTTGFFGYMPFYDTLVRAHFGNPDYRPRALPSTIGTEFNMMYPPPYALSVDGTYIEFWQNNEGYHVLPGAPRLSPDVPTLFYNNSVPTYAYTVAPERMNGSNDARLTRADTIPVTSYTHNIDNIHVWLTNNIPDNILVLTETAYPGWKVSIDGEPATLESVGGLIGVRLPTSLAGRPLSVVFSYEPPLLYLGGFITLLSVPLFAFYILGSNPRQIAYALRAVTRRMNDASVPDGERGTLLPVPQPGTALVPPAQAAPISTTAAPNGASQQMPVHDKTSVYMSPIVISLVISTLTAALTYVLVANRPGSRSDE